MNEVKWVNKAMNYVETLTEKWENNEHLRGYCESLYETYIEEDISGDAECTPEDAVNEDMTYWDNE